MEIEHFRRTYDLLLESIQSRQKINNDIKEYNFRLVNKYGKYKSKYVHQDRATSRSQFHKLIITMIVW